MKVCTDCKKTGQCGMELDAKLEGMEVTFCARKEKINVDEVDGMNIYVKEEGE